MESINGRICQILKELSLTKNSLSVKLGYTSNTTTGKIINGLQKPGFDFLNRLLQTFKRIDANWLFSGDGEMYINNVHQDEKNASYEKEIKYLTELCETKNQLIEQFKKVSNRNNELSNQIETFGEIIKDFQKDKEGLKEQLRKCQMDKDIKFCDVAENCEIRSRLGG